MERKYDGIIFDLDGTLWDSVKTVTEIWNEALRDVGIEPTLTYDELSKCMGLRIEQIFDRVIPQTTRDQRDKIVKLCEKNENTYLSDHGGVLYENVEKTLNDLKKDYKLFIVSNCGEGYIRAFYKAHKLEKYFDDFECAGRTGLSKGQNIKLISQRNDLKNPVYIGDTLFDYEATKEAQVPFIFAAYGFGELPFENQSVNSFEEIRNAVEN